MITGPSGSGKSTLLNLLGLIDTPSSGEIELNGVKTLGLTEGQRQRLRLKMIGFVFQMFNLIPTLNVRENIEFPLALAGKSQRVQKGRAEELIDRVGLMERLHHQPKQLSVGEMQRVAIARALANQPEILLADEPTGELDNKTGQHIMEFLRSQSEEDQLTVLMVTHNLELGRYADTRLQLVDGILAS